MPSLLTVRAKTEAELLAILEKLDRRHKARVRAALERYGSVEAIPFWFWAEMQREIQDETVAALLILMMDADDWTAGRIQGQLKTASFSPKPTLDYARLAASQAERMAQDATRRLRNRLATASLDDVFTQGRRNLIARNETVGASTSGQMGAAGRFSGAGGDGASVFGGQRTRIDLIWTNHPELSKTGPCPVCEPLHGLSQAEWSIQFPTGPMPALGVPHNGCVCTLEPRVIVFGI